MNDKLISLCVRTFLPRQEVLSSKKILVWDGDANESLTISLSIYCLHLDISAVITHKVLIWSVFIAKFGKDKLVLQKLISLVAPNCYIPLPSIVGFLLAILCVQFQTDALWPRALKIFDNPSLQLLRSYACWAGFVSTNRRTILGWCPNFTMTGHTCCDMLIALILKLEKMWYQTLLEFHLQSSFWQLNETLLTMISTIYIDTATGYRIDGWSVWVLPPNSLICQSVFSNFTLIVLYCFLSSAKISVKKLGCVQMTNQF